MAWRGNSDDAKWTPKPEVSWYFDHAVFHSVEEINNRLHREEDSDAPPSTHQANSQHHEAGDGAKIEYPDHVVVIPCGVLKQTESMLVDPGRSLQVSVDVENGSPVHSSAKTTGERVAMSILQWRLHQIHQWARASKAARPFPVFLMTSPETERVVAQEVSRFRATLDWLHHLEEETRNQQTGKQETKLEILITPQMLVPALKTDSVDKRAQRIFTLQDGGWLLQARGQLDLLRILARWRTHSGEESRHRRCALTFSYNNLGDLFNHTTCEHLSQYKRYFAAVELYLLEEPNNTRDKRWTMMSYDTSKHGDVATLTKREREEPKAWFSTNTWYINLNELEKDTLIDELPYRFARKDDIVWLVQDIELITKDSEKRRIEAFRIE